MPNSARKARLNWLPVIITAALGIFREIAPEILGDELKKFFGSHLRWVWAAFAVAVVYALYAEWKNRRADGEVAEPAQLAVNQSGQRHAVIHGDDNTTVTGDSNILAAGAAGNVAGRDITNITHYHAQPAGRSAAHQLPAPKPDFTGREAELAELKARLRQDGQRGVAIAGAQGMGGVGKTELAIKLAEELQDDYPDAQIFLDLRGASERPVTTAQALEHAIRALDPELMGRLPESIEELQALYRARLHGQRALLIWDNVKDAAHVAPLVPPAACAMIVTSRLHFVLPGVSACHLEALPPDDARRLLQRIAPRLTDAEADTLAALCGRLPLALRLTGSALAERPNIRPVKYAQQFAAKLARMELPDEIEASLSLSYELIGHAQPDGLQKWWRQLAVFPATFDDAAAAAVWQMAVDDAINVLAELIRYSLVDYDAPSDRYELQDLARVFAGSRMEEEERAAAQFCHAQHFCGVLAEAGKLYKAGHDQIKAGLALFNRERANIIAGMTWAASQPEANQQAAELCIEYLNVGVYVISLRLHRRELIRWLEIQLAIARRLQRRNAEGAALGNLGTAYRDLSEFRKAIEFHEQALLISREIGDRRAESADLAGLGNAYRNLGEWSKAIEFYKRCLELQREIGDRRGEAIVLGNLGIVHKDLGELRTAIELYEQHRDIAQEIGDRLSEGNALGNLGNAYTNLGELRKAIRFHEQDLAIQREIGDRHGEGNALTNLGNASADLGESRKAIEFYEQHRDIAREIGDRLSEGNALGNLGCAYRDVGETQKAIEFHEQYLAIAREIDDRQGEANALGNLGAAFADLAEPRKAIEFYEQHCDIAREIGDRRGEGNALWNMALALDGLGERGRAVECAEAALKIYEEIESPYAAAVREELTKWRN